MNTTVQVSKRIILAAIAACACLALFSSCQSEKKNFLQRMFDIEERAKKNAPPSSIDELKAGIDKYYDVVERTVEANSKVGLYWRLLAVRYMEKGMFGEAYDAALKGLRYYPDNSSLYYVAAMSAAYLSRTASADINAGMASREAWLKTSENSYLAALKFNEKSTRALYGIAILYVFEFDRSDQAIPYLERLLDITKLDMDGLFLYARALYSVGKLQESADVYDKIIKSSKVKEKREQAEQNKKQILDQLYGG